LCYLAPEVFENQKYGTEIDWWALGILICEMLFKVPPFFSMQENRMIEKIQKQRIVFPAQCSFQAKHLLCGLLERNPSKRFSYKDVENHSFFEGMKFDDVLQKKYLPSFIPLSHLQKIEILNEMSALI
jgi:serine/threonine protein kinase